jgi:hypothetical protein
MFQDDDTTTYGIYIHMVPPELDKAVGKVMLGGMNEDLVPAAETLIDR